MQGIAKSFPGVQALDDVDLSVQAGEVHALVGENGAGKSTLIKILAGVHQPDRGQIRVDGRPIHFASPRAALQVGIGIIYQEFNLAPALTAWENLFLGRENAPWGLLSRRRERQWASQQFARLGVDIPLDVPCHELSIAQQQIVEIAKALVQQARLLVMDEPTTALTPSEVQRLMELIQELCAQGLGVIYISHRLEEIRHLADRATVLRDGRCVGTLPREQMDRQRLIEWMVGRKIDNEYPKQVAPRGPVRLQVKNLRRGTSVQDVSLSVHAGEVLGITGLVGSGRTETARLIFGADRPDGGTIFLDGRRLVLPSPRAAILAGICLLTEDRKHQGLMLERSVQENFGLPNLSQFARWGWIHSRGERLALAGFCESLKIKVPHPETPVGHLSGGNQQKVVLAKWLQANASVIIFDEPTRGIDVGGKYDLYLLINRLAQAGKAILMISSELPEVLGMSDRVLVMHDGRVTGEIRDPQQASQASVMQMAMG
jgi:ABC-type sugar transport system ATPase subunit